MSSSNTTVGSNGALNVSIGSPIGTTYSYSASNGIGSINVIDTKPTYIEEPSMSLLVTQGEPQLIFFETENGRRVKMVLEPDTGMSVNEQLRISMMTHVMKESALRLHFSPLAYIRKHNLERHFRFST